MKPRVLLKDLFALAVRLVGLYFIYRGLNDLDVPAFTDVTLLKSDNLDDVITTLLPVVYNLAVGWWLLGNNLLSRRAYPESSRFSGRVFPPAGSTTTASAPLQKSELSEMQSAETKLAALVVKSRDGQPAK